MSKLQTPLGALTVYFDGIEQKGGWQKLPNLVRSTTTIYAEIDERYCYRFDFVNDGKQHFLKCVFEAVATDVQTEIESGENYEAWSFYSGYTKLTLGSESVEEWYHPFNKYETSYLPNGLQYEMNPNTKSQVFVFCAAWVPDNDPDDFDAGKRDCRTWFAADPHFLKE